MDEAIHIHLKTNCFECYKCDSTLESLRFVMPFLGQRFSTWFARTRVTEVSLGMVSHTPQRVSCTCSRIFYQVSLNFASLDLPNKVVSSLQPTTEIATSRNKTSDYLGAEE